MVDLPGVNAHLDDICGGGTRLEEHVQRLNSVLLRLQEAGPRVQKAKCRLGVVEVTYLGHRIDTGVYATYDNLKAIKELPEPNSKTTLRSFLGMLAFYDRFLEIRATVTVNYASCWQTAQSGDGRNITLLLSRIWSCCCAKQFQPAMMSQVNIFCLATPCRMAVE